MTPAGSDPTPTLRTDPAVARSLLEGEGIIDVRPATETLAPGTRCWLEAGGGPPAELKPAYRALAELSPAPDGPMAAWVEVARSGIVHLDESALEALNGKTVVVLDHQAGADVAVLALRVHRLSEPRPAGGALAADPATLPGEPALSDGAFEAKLNGLAESLPALKG